LLKDKSRLYPDEAAGPAKKKSSDAVPETLEEVKTRLGDERSGGPGQITLPLRLTSNNPTLPAGQAKSITLSVIDEPVLFVIRHFAYVPGFEKLPIVISEHTSAVCVGVSVIVAVGTGVSVIVGEGMAVRVRV